MKRVVVGLSGGVDSSVAAYLLKQQGYEVIGMFMKNWHDTSVTVSDECPWIEDSNDALLVAQKLGIPFSTLDLSKEYKERIVDYMFAEYEAGRTPNPDVLCNREIKFDLFLKAAERIQADFVATGHYCRVESIETPKAKVFRLMEGKDGSKDQSYFLCQVNQYQLSKSLFPIGNLHKSEVRKIAHDLGLVTADKPDSQGLCFIGKVKLPIFLQQQLKPKEGRILEIEKDRVIEVEDPQKNPLFESNLIKYTIPHDFSKLHGIDIGQHQGAHYFTIGQRKGLQVGGTPLPLFVMATDTQENLVYVGQGADHPGLWRWGLQVEPENVHWIREDLKLEIGQKKDFEVRIRYRQKLQNATLYQRKEALYVLFKTPQKAIAPGQFVAWYQFGELLGSGVIAS
jgi:tRNA-specific 2-thiouridylase